jgi:hypothetical protein
MNPATFHPHSRSTRSRIRRHAERSAEKLEPVSHSFLEPRGEGILFAVFCLLSSAIIYCGVLLFRFLG